MPDDAGFGTLLRSHRRRAGLSQEELSARAFVSTRAISDLERGVNARPRLHTAVALADGLALDAAERAVFERHARPVDDPLGPAAAAVGRAQPPLPLDSFIDDGTMLDALTALVADRTHRLVTLVGPGGVGETRLALELSRRMARPVAYVPLAALTDADLVAAEIADALGVEHGPLRSHLDSLRDDLGGRDLVLVLDNFEQVVAAATDVAVLLHAAADITVVVTSRVPLQIAGEVRFAVHPLAVAPVDGHDATTSPAVRLFCDRAAAAGAESDPAAVAELCARLDGLPLAVELAAARAAVVAPAEMVRHLEHALDLLTAGRVDGPVHHRSMRAALEWSYHLLTPESQAALDALGVFVTGAPVDAVQAVWALDPSMPAAFYDLVQPLADAHLVAIAPTGDGSTEVTMFETTRQFARHRLDASGRAPVVGSRLAQWAGGLAQRAEAGLVGPDQMTWLAVLDRQLPNLRAAARHLADTGTGTGTGTDAAVDAALALAAALQRYWEIRCGWEVGAAWVRDALARPGGDDRTRARAHKALGVMYRCLGRLELAEPEHARAAELFEAAADPAGMAACRNNQGVVALDRADFERADELFRRALAACESIGEQRLHGIVLNNLSLSARELGSLLEAMRRSRRSRELFERSGNVAVQWWADANLASAMTLAGHPHWAAPLHEAAIRGLLDVGDENGFTWALEALADTWTELGRVELAGRALGFVAAHRRRLGAVEVPYFALLTSRRRDRLVERIGDARAGELWRDGEQLDPALVRAWFHGD